MYFKAHFIMKRVNGSAIVVFRSVFLTIIIIVKVCAKSGGNNPFYVNFFICKSTDVNDVTFWNIFLIFAMKSQIFARIKYLV